MTLLPKAKTNSFFSNSIFIFLIRFFPSLANLVILLLYSRSLDKETYGTYQNFWIQLNVLYPFACFGIHVLIITYSPAFLLKLAQKLKASQYLLYGLWAIMLCALFALFQYQHIHTALAVPLLFILVYAATIILEATLIVFKDFKALTFLNLLYAIAYCFIHWYVLRNGFSFSALFSYLLVLGASRLVIYIILTFNSAKKYTGTQPTEELLIGRIRSLWLHLGFYDVLQVFFSWIDKFAISFLFSAEISGLYFNGSMNIPFLPLLLSAAGSAVLIQVSSLNKAEGHKHIIYLVNQTGRLLSCIVFPVFLFLFFYRYELFGWLLPGYMAAVPIFAVSIFSLPVKAYSFTTVLQQQHKGSIINTGAVLDLLLACCLMYPLYKWLGLPGIALSFVVTTYLQALYYLVYAARSLSVASIALLPYLNWLTKLIVFVVLFIVIHYISSLYFAGIISLILGGGFTIAMIVSTLLIEIRNRNNIDGATTPQAQH